MSVRRLSNVLLAVTILMPIQFLLGMWINLFVKIPNPFAADFLSSAGGAVLIVHILNGLTLAGLAITATLLIARLHRAVPFRLSVAATLFLFLAIAGGIIFDFFGQKDVFSYTMAIGFVFSVSLFTFAGRFLMQGQPNPQKSAA